MSDKPGLRPQQAVGQALRDVARHILAEGRTAVEDKKRVEAVAIHDFRVAMKSWRAFLRLVEPHLHADAGRSMVSRSLTSPRGCVRITGGRGTSFRTTGGRPARTTFTSCASVW